MKAVCSHYAFMSQTECEHISDIPEQVFDYLFRLPYCDLIKPSIYVAIRKNKGSMLSIANKHSVSCKFVNQQKVKLCLR